LHCFAVHLVGFDDQKEADDTFAISDCEGDAGLDFRGWALSA